MAKRGRRYFEFIEFACCQRLFQFGHAFVKARTSTNFAIKNEIGLIYKFGKDFKEYFLMFRRKLEWT